MAHINRKYIDSHWLVFIFQGLVALCFGCLTLFTGQESSSAVVPLVGLAILALAVIEFTNSLHRSRHRQGWIVSTMVAFFDVIFGVIMVMIAEQGMSWHLFVLAGYTMLRGIFELLIGFRTTVDPTDRFIWVLCGVCGLLFGIVILNSGHLANVDFIRFFGSYMLILGTASLIYGIHNRSQQIEDRVARKEAATKTAKAAKKSPRAKSSKKA